MAGTGNFPNYLIDDSAETVRMVLAYLPVDDIAAFLHEFAETVAEDPDALEQMLSKSRRVAQNFRNWSRG